MTTDLFAASFICRNADLDAAAAWLVAERRRTRLRVPARLAALWRRPRRHDPARVASG